MQAKKITVDIPSYLTIGQYQEISKYKNLSPIEKLVKTVSALTGIQEDEIRTWPVDTIQTISDDLAAVADPKNEFHSIIKWNDTVYGYSHIANSSLGEYIDIENLSQDLENNLHKLCAIFYRPITKNRIGGIKWIAKHSWQLARNKVENVFDYYEVDKYNSTKRKEVEDQFKDFPVHIMLGALSFFLGTGSLYLLNIQSLENQIPKKVHKKLEKQILQALSQNTGDGLGLYTHFRRHKSSTSQEKVA